MMCGLPGVEPVDGGAADEGGELTRADAEGGADGGEAEEHLQVPPDLEPVRSGGSQCDRAVRRSDREGLDFS